VALALTSGCAHTALHATTTLTSSGGAIPKRAFGKTGVAVSCIGVGGWHLGAVKDSGEAIRIVQEAIDAGVTFFDNAWEYHDGESEKVLGLALEGRRDQVFLMTKVCTHGRDATVALRQLDESLKRLRTDHLDVWQIHECIYDDDPELHFAKDGVVQALTSAKAQGKARFVGFTGHKDPSIHSKMLSYGYPFDSVQMPLNCFDGSFRSFEQRVLPEAQKRGMAVIGMKSMNGHAPAVLAGVLSAEEMLRYAMSIPGVTTTVSGIDSLDILRQNLAVARGFTPLSAEERAALRQRVAFAASDGRFELYKTTKHYDANVGREQHGYPSSEEVPF
jgi:aryl-alcohol dehydrogenase-like predicted oxidoreductase